MLMLESGVPALQPLTFNLQAPNSFPKQKTKRQLHQRAYILLQDEYPCSLALDSRDTLLL
jgi:hypothetical protein